MRTEINAITGTEELIVDTIQEVDLSSIKCPVISIFKEPYDFPEDYVARIFDGYKPTNVIMIASCLWILQYDIEKYTNLIFFEKDPKDVPSLIGTYI